MFRKNSGLSFSEKQPSVKGIFSAALGLLALVICIAAVVIAYNRKGNAGQLIGSCGIMALLSSLMGFFFGIGGMLERDKRRVSAVIGFVLSAALSAGLIFLFIKGLL